MTVMIAVAIVGLVCGYILASFLPARITALAWVVLLSVNTASLLETRDMFRAAAPEEFPGPRCHHRRGGLSLAVQRGLRAGRAGRHDSQALALMPERGFKPQAFRARPAP
jgi:hypothetical protein